jgi:hypothetical protein
LSEESWKSKILYGLVGGAIGYVGTMVQPAVSVTLFGSQYCVYVPDEDPAGNGVDSEGRTQIVASTEYGTYRLIPRRGAGNYYVTDQDVVDISKMGDPTSLNYQTEAIRVKKNQKLVVSGTGQMYVIVQKKGSFGFGFLGPSPTC